MSLQKTNQSSTINWDDGLSLEEAIKVALDSNYELKATRRQLDIAKAQLTTARAWPKNPELELEGENDRLLTDDGEYGYGFKLSQEFETGHQRIYRIDIAQAGIDRTKALISDKGRIIKALVQNAFYTVLFAESNLILGGKTVELKAQLLKIANSRLRPSSQFIVDDWLALPWGQEPILLLRARPSRW